MKKGFEFYVESITENIESEETVMAYSSKIAKFWGKIFGGYLKRMHMTNRKLDYRYNTRNWGGFSCGFIWFFTTCLFRRWGRLVFKAVSLLEEVVTPRKDLPPLLLKLNERPKKKKKKKKTWLSLDFSVECFIPEENWETYLRYSGKESVRQRFYIQHTWL